MHTMFWKIIRTSRRALKLDQRENVNIFYVCLFSRNRNNVWLGLIYIKFRKLKRTVCLAFSQMLSLNVPACYQCIASQMRIHISSSDSRNELGFQHIFVTVNMMLNFVSRGRWRGIAGRSGGYLSGSKVQLLLFCFCCTEHQPVVGR